MEDLTGKQIGPFQIVRFIGKGGMAVVYEAYQPSVGRSVALKVLPYGESDTEFVGRFKHEAHTIARLEHPYILPVYDAGEDQGYLYIAMRLVTTGTLADKLKNGQPLPLAQTLRIISQVGEALDHAHSQGVIHRDLKPNNILIDARGNCLLADFGIAKMIEATTRFTQTGGVIGTPAYMSPEQAMSEPLDGRSDIYSLGVVLYQIVVGQVPFTATTPVAVLLQHTSEPPPPPRTINPSLPVSVERVILKALSKKPDDRFSTAGEMAHALKAAIEQPTAPPTFIEPPPPKATVAPPPRITQPSPTLPPSPPSGGIGMGMILGAAGGLASLAVLAVIAAAVFYFMVVAPQPQSSTQTPIVVVQEVTPTRTPGGVVVSATDTRIAPPITNTPTPSPTPEPAFDIAFTSDHDGADAIYLMDTESADWTQLTDPVSPIQDWWPSWCNHNQEILFERGDHKQGTDSQHVYTVSVAQPFAERQWSNIPSGSMWTGHPVCSRDNRHVSFNALFPGDQSFTLWMADLNQGRADLFGSGYAIPGSMDISPDGYTAVFSYIDTNATERQWVLYTADVSRPFDIYSIQPVGVTGSLFPAWSPDGRQIAFACRVGEWGLCVTDSSGSYYRLIVADLRLELVERKDIKFNNPTWSPDGQWIAYASDADGDWDIYVIRADGTSKRNLTQDWPSNEFYPAWRP